MKRLVALWLLLGVPCVHAHAVDRGFDVREYRLTLRVDIDAKRIAGTQRITLESRQGDITLDAGGLAIDSVREHGHDLPFRSDASKLVIDAGAAGVHRIDIAYHGQPRYGLEFHPERHEAYTIFSTSQWMPSIDAPDSRAVLDLTLVTPANQTVVASGRHVGSRPFADGTVAHRWRSAVPRPGFLYAFAIGPYRRIALPGRGPGQWLYASDGDAAYGDAFARTAEITAFLADKAGMRIPGDEYSQAIVADTIGQEADGLALLSTSYARDLQARQADDSLIAHELAHQWWGSLLTCHDWGQFWLNEGFATFMAAAWVEHRDGHDAYLQRVAAWQARVDRLRGEGKDRSLVFATWKPNSDNRAVAYQKGALFLHTLRESLGDALFWRGIREYTRANANRSVVTADFRRAMEHASGRDLGPLFGAWAAEPDQ